MSGGLGAEPEGSSRRMRVAEVFDGRGPAGGVVINRPQVEPAEMAALTAYLTKAPVALATTKTGEDEMAPGAGLVVPRAYHTDGVWIWPAAVGYYLHRYRLPPQNELLAHIRARRFRVGAVAEELRQAAAAQMLEELAAAKRASATGGGTAGSGLDSGPMTSGGITGSGLGSGSGASGTATRPATGPGASGASPNAWSTGTWLPSAPARPSADPEPSAARAAAEFEPSVSGGMWTPEPLVPAPAPPPEAVVSAAVGPMTAPPVGPAVPAPVVQPAEPSLWLPAPAGEPEVESVPEPVMRPESTAEPVAEPVTWSESAAEPEPIVRPESEPVDEPEPVVRPASEPVAEPEPVDESGPVAEPVAEPASESPAVESAFVELEPEPEEAGEGFGAAFTAAGNRHAAWVYEQIETFLAFMPLDEWSVDHATGRYRQAGREFTVDALGRLGRDGRWTWAWAESEAWSPRPALTEHARRLRDRGGQLGIRELTEPVLDLAAIADAEDPETAAEMLAWTAMGVAGARGYIGHEFGDDNRVYYLAFDESIPTAHPNLDAAAHYLTQGVGKFEEDPSDCVIGYVEHHGWDWSRSAEGLVVSAPGLGAFTVILAVDGSLTGVRRHD